MRRDYALGFHILVGLFYRSLKISFNKHFTKKSRDFVDFLNYEETRESLEEISLRTKIMAKSYEKILGLNFH